MSASDLLINLCTCFLDSRYSESSAVFPCEVLSVRSIQAEGRDNQVRSGCSTWLAFYLNNTVYIYIFIFIYIYILCTYICIYIHNYIYIHMHIYYVGLYRIFASYSLRGRIVG